MPEFILDVSGEVPRPDDYKGWGVERPLRWTDLDPFEQGYVEALFFTEEEALAEQAREMGTVCDALGFSDLAPDALLSIKQDCAKFRDTGGAVGPQRPWSAVMVAIVDPRPHEVFPEDPERQAGHDFWLTRNGHGSGFWDGDWPEPHATTLTHLSRSFGPSDVYLGDDGKLYVS